MKKVEIKKSTRTLFGADVDMLSGALPSSLIKYAFPLILTSMLNVLYNAADIAVVGNFASPTAVASIGATSSTINLIVMVFINISNGMSIILARYRGASDVINVRKSISTGYAFSLVFGVIVMSMGWLLAEPMMKITGCPDNVIDGAVLYIKLYMIGVPASMFYNFMSTVLRTMGDSRRPFIYLALSGLANVVFNLIFVLCFKMDVDGVAIATVISQYLSAVLLFVRLVRFRDENRLQPLQIKAYGDTLGKMIRYGIPSAISGASFSLSNIIIQSAINEYGDYAIAGNTAGGHIETIFLYSITAPLCQTAATFIGQNIGAGNRERVAKIARQIYLYGAAFVAVIGTVSLIFGRELLTLFVGSDAASVDFGIVGLRLKMMFCVVFVLLQVSNGIMQAFGFTTYQMINSLVGIVGVRFIWMLLVYPIPAMHTPIVLYICYGLTWIISLIGAMPVALTLLRKYKKGKEFKL